VLVINIGVAAYVDVAADKIDAGRIEIWCRYWLPISCRGSDGLSLRPDRHAVDMTAADVEP